MKYIIRHQFRNINIIGLDFYVTNFFQKFYNELKEKYPQHEFEIYTYGGGVGDGGYFRRR
jgi:hypothetical protein